MDRGVARDDVVAIWSAKGGVGATTIAVAASVVLGRGTDHDAVFVDLAGDAPTVFAIPEPDGPGVIDWLAADDAVTADALARLEHPAAAGVGLVHRGRRATPRIERVPALLDGLGASGRPVVLDVGVVGPADDRGVDALVRRAAIEGSGRSLLVTRACFIALRRALATGVKPDGVVLVEEPGRALGRTDVSDVVGAPIVATVAVDPAIARAIDAGLLAARLPADLGRALIDVG